MVHLPLYYLEIWRLFKIMSVIFVFPSYVCHKSHFLFFSLKKCIQIYHLINAMKDLKNLNIFPSWEKH